MKITICCSLSFKDEVLEIQERLKSMGHHVLLPDTIIESQEKGIADAKTLSAEYQANDIMHVAKKMKLHYQKIKDSDAVLVCNYAKNGVNNYIGASSFLEMGIAFDNDKKIFLLNDVPEMGLKDEVEAMEPVVIRQDLRMIC
jgi:hypothetical protein